MRFSTTSQLGEIQITDDGHLQQTCSTDQSKAWRVPVSSVISIEMQFKGSQVSVLFSTASADCIANMVPKSKIRELIQHFPGIPINEVPAHGRPERRLWRWYRSLYPITQIVLGCLVLILVLFVCSICAAGWPAFLQGFEQGYQKNQPPPISTPTSDTSGARMGEVVLQAQQTRRLLFVSPSS
jgi:hypothetical protein